MPLKIYRLIYLTLGILLLVEVGLELRAHFRGWNTILGGIFNILPASEMNNSQSQFGPSKNFPFRSMIVPIEKAPGTSRLWIASSSYAQDNYLKASQIFPNLIAQKLNQSDFPIQVLNAAQEGQTIDGNILVLKEIASEWKPDFILLYQMNLDINELSQQFCSGLNSQTNTNNNLHNYESQIKPKLDWGEKLFEKTTVYQLLKENVTARLSQSRILTQDIGKEARKGFRQRIYDFIKTSRYLGATPILCTFATSYDLHHPEKIPMGVKDFLLRYNIYLSISGWCKAIDQFNDDIREIGKEQNVLVIDINHYLNGEPQYFRDFVHFTPEGHKMMTKVITEELLRNKDMLLKATLKSH